MRQKFLRQSSRSKLLHRSGPRLLLLHRLRQNGGRGIETLNAGPIRSAYISLRFNQVLRMHQRHNPRSGLPDSRSDRQIFVELVLFDIFQRHQRGRVKPWQANQLLREEHVYGNVNAYFEGNRLLLQECGCDHKRRKIHVSPGKYWENVAILLKLRNSGQLHSRSTFKLPLDNSATWYAGNCLRKRLYQVERHLLKSWRTFQFLLCYIPCLVRRLLLVANVSRNFQQGLQFPEK